MINSPHTLRIMYWNARSIRNKIVEFYHYLTTNDIQIACLSETFLKPSDHLLSHPDFRIYRLDRPNEAGGGVAILVDRKLKHELLPHLNMRHLEAIGIELFLENQQKIRIFSAYLPGGGTSENQRLVRQHFIHDLRRITRYQGNCSYFICGDLNARHRHFNCVSSNLAGRLLYDEYIQSDYIIALPSAPTHYPEDPRRSPSTIDIMITNSLLPYSDLKCDYLGSDHDAVVTDIELSNPSIENNERYVRAYGKTDWRAYQRSILRRLDHDAMDLDQITTTAQIDERVEKLTKAIMDSQDDCVPLILPSQHRLQLTTNLEQLISLRRFLRRRWYRTRNPLLKQEVNALTSQIRNGTQTLRNEDWSRRLQDLPTDDNKKSLWKIEKFLKNRNRGVPGLKQGDSILLTSEEKAEALANKFSEFHDNPLRNANAVFTTSVEDAVNEYLSDLTDVTPEYPEVSETISYVKRLRNSKAPGRDRVHNTLIKHLPQRALIYLNFIICCCLKMSYFPQHWKRATVIPIKKPGKDSTLLTSYRPISLLSCLSKILERVILKRMNIHTEEFNVLPDAQHGFRQFRSTTNQLNRVLESLRHNLNEKRTTGILFFDIEKAFDRIWSKGLIYKMINLQYPKYLVRIIASFLQHREFQVKVNEKLSSRQDVPFGVPQGAVLSPALYNIYVSDAPIPNDCMMAFYADDTAIISGANRWGVNARALRRATQSYHQYYDKWKINLNFGKTQALLVTRRRTRELPYGPFIMGDDEIPWDSEAKYLGLIIDRTLTFKPHIDYVIQKTQNAIRLLYPLIHRKSKLSMQNKVIIFKAALRPIYTYACPLFDRIAHTNLKKLQVIQNKILKMIFDLPWRTPTIQLHLDNNIELVSDFANKLRMRFQQRLQFQ